MHARTASKDTYITRPSSRCSCNSAHLCPVWESRGLVASLLLMATSALRRIELAFDILSEVTTLLGAAPIPIADGVLRLLRVVLEMREVRLRLLVLPISRIDAC